MTSFIHQDFVESLPKDLQSLVAFQEETDLFRLHFYEKVSSTNDIAQKLAKENHPHGTVVVADSQQRGRGRQGRVWLSPPGVNIYMSIILRPETTAFSPTLITLAASLATVMAIQRSEVRSQKSLEVWPKWPNDICCEDGKLGGVLTEALIKRDRTIYMVTGIGVNVNMRREEIPEAMGDKITSLFMETSEVYERGEIIINILKAFQSYYDLLFSAPSSITALWCKESRTINRYVDRKSVV